MKLKHIFQLGLILSMMSLMNCGSDDEQPPAPKQDPSLKSIQFTADAAFTITGHPKPVKLNIRGIYDNGANRAISDYDVLVNGESEGKLSAFSSDEEGIYQLKVVSGELESETLAIRVRPALELETKTFRIIFHIVHDGEEVGTGYNISADRIDYQMSLLEKTFERPVNVTPNSFQPMMDFELATVDPDGNVLAEPGINRLQRPNQDASVLFQDWMWDHYWDPDYYINVWVGDTKNGYSWGIYPDLDCQSPVSMEGLACSDADFPTRIEGIALELDNLWEENWVFPHEMGHVFGLFHIFSGSECDTDVDFCADTHQYDRQAYEGNQTGVERVSCDGQEFTSYNVMDYWNQPRGIRDLSYDQVVRMRTVIDHGKWRGSKSLSDGTPRDMSSRGGG